jgi:hypothetical protein
VLVLARILAKVLKHCESSSRYLNSQSRTYHFIAEKRG